MDEWYEAVAVIVLSEGVDFELETWFFVLILCADAASHKYGYGTIEHDPRIGEMLDIVDTIFGIDVGVVVADALGLVVVGECQGVASGRTKTPLDVASVVV